MKSNEHKRTTVETEQKVLPLMQKIKEHSGLPIKRITSLLLSYGYEVYIKDPSILIKQISKDKLQN